MNSEADLIAISKSLQLAQSDLAEKWPQDLSLNLVGTKTIEGDPDLDRDLGIEIERAIESAELTGSNIEALKNSFTHYQRLAAASAQALAEERVKNAEAAKLLGELEQVLQNERRHAENLERQNRDANAVIVTQNRRIETLRARSFNLIERLDGLSDVVKTNDSIKRGR